MRHLSWRVAAIVLSLCLQASAFDRSEWKLVFEDNFERAEVGADWIIKSKSTIVDGRLKFGVEGDHGALIDRRFAPDVRVEFDAENPVTQIVDRGIAVTLDHLASTLETVELDGSVEPLPHSLECRWVERAGEVPSSHPGIGQRRVRSEGAVGCYESFLKESVPRQPFRIPPPVQE